jgi:uncharacterized protein YaiE (UPF0345 family)
MEQFDQVSVIKNANVYFDGKVTSRTIVFSDGTRKTLGIMLPGEYEFNTEAKELMEILSGEAEVLLPGTEARIVHGGESFEVPGNSSFQVKVTTITDYCCSFLD